MPWRSLRSTRRAQNQYSSPAQVLASCSRLSAVSVCVPLTAQAQRRVREVDLRMPGNEVVERLDAEPVHPQPAAGTGCLVRLAAPLRAIGQDRLQRRAVEARDRQLGQADIDRLLVAGMHDRRHRQPGAGNDRLSILDGDAGQVHLAASRHIQVGCLTGARPRYRIDQRASTLAEQMDPGSECRDDFKHPGNCGCGRSPRRSSGARPSDRRRRSRAPLRSSQ